MQFNNHSKLAGQHSFLSPSNYHWINYDIEHLEDKFSTAMTAQLGSELHDLAAKLIRHGIKLPDNGKTLSRYVNDAIGYRMSPEQTLFYSFNCFGTADAISYRDRLLRIHDLKNGVTPAKVQQLEVYASLFCLEYDVSPFDIEIELRIYQNDDTVEYETDRDAITHIMEKIKVFDKRINEMRLEAMA